ncbi:MAG: zinc ribbon domain-containing protein [Firmicutes bacterium]|nr:zinc ribbon domain-containing protein [Bacillota bacterium]
MPSNGVSNTSRTCPQCGLIDPRNRPDPAHFPCISCGFAGPADPIAAGNIARRAAVNPPHPAGASA